MSVLVHLFAVLPPVGHVLPPPQVLLAAKSAAGWTPLWLGETRVFTLFSTRGNEDYVHSQTWLLWMDLCWFSRCGRVDADFGMIIFHLNLSGTFFWETIAKKYCVTANSSILLTWTFHFVLLYYIILLIFFSLVKSCTSVLPTSNTKHFGLFVDSTSMDSLF